VSAQGSFMSFFSTSTMLPSPSTSNIWWWMYSWVCVCFGGRGGAAIDKDVLRVEMRVWVCEWVLAVKLVAGCNEQACQ
jgi:hypothetical protein